MSAFLNIISLISQLTEVEKNSLSRLLSSQLNENDNDNLIDELILNINTNLSTTIHHTDDEIDELIKNSRYQRWIKKIPFNSLINFEDYKYKELFVPVANIIHDNELNDAGNKKRQTLIKFENKIDINDFRENTEWVYLFTINNKIVKIGGTRDGLSGRVNSYLCGHHIPERNKSGDCSKTNGFIYNTFEFYTNLGYNIKMYGYKLPKVTHETEILEEKIKIKVQTYHAYESKFLENYKKLYDKYPILSDNADPNYK